MKCSKIEHSSTLEHGLRIAGVLKQNNIAEKILIIILRLSVENFFILSEILFPDYLKREMQGRIGFQWLTWHGICLFCN